MEERYEIFALSEDNVYFGSDGVFETLIINTPMIKEISFEQTTKEGMCTVRFPEVTEDDWLGDNECIRLTCSDEVVVNAERITWNDCDIELGKE